MATTIDKKYFAFISYKREDEAWAKWLQYKLEHYKLPTNLNGRNDLPKEIRPIFRDKSDLAGGVLADEINNALENSKYLIVICSPKAAHSEWVGKEVQTFIDLGRTDKIIPFIVGGTAHAQNQEEECFPLALRELSAEQELLGVNINEMGRDAAAVKVVAQMFGLKFDELWQRYEREQKKRRNWIITASIVGFLVMAGVAFWMYFQRQQTLKANWEMMEKHSLMVVEKTNKTVNDNPYLVKRVLVDIMPIDLKDPDKPCLPELEAAFRQATSLHYMPLLQHFDDVNTISYSPDGKFIVSASWDGLLLIWDAETGNLLKSLHEPSLHEDLSDELNIDILYKYEISSAFYSPDGKHIVAAYRNGTIIIWDTETGEIVKKQEGFKKNAVANFTPDGKKIIIFSYDMTIWDIESGAIIHQEFPWYDYVFYYCRFSLNVFSPDGKYIVTTSDMADISIWSTETGEIVKTWNKDRTLVDQASYSPDGKFIVYVENNGPAVVMDAETGNNIYKTSNYYNRVLFSHDGKYLFCSYYDEIKILDAENGKELKTLKGKLSSITTFAISPDDKYISVGYTNGSIRIWDVEYEEDITIIDNCDIINTPTFTPDGQSMVLINKDGTLKYLNLKTKQETEVKNSNSDSMYFATYSPSGKKVYVMYPDTTSAILTVDDSIIISALLGNGYKGLITIGSGSFSPDNKRVTTTAFDSTARIWNVETGVELKKFNMNTPYVTASSFSPDGRHLAIAYDTTIVVYDANTFDVVSRLNGHKNWIRQVSFSSDGKYLVSASYDKNLILWDPNEGVQLRKMIGHTDWVYNVSFSSDSHYIVSCSKDRTVRVWDTSTGVPIQIYEGYSNTALFATFTPGGRNIVSYSDDNTIRIWDFPPLQELIDQTRERFKDYPLTKEERRMYYLE